MIQIFKYWTGAMLDFNSSLERYNSNGYRTPFIFILLLGSILRTGEQNEMFKARRLFGNRKRRKATQRFNPLPRTLNMAAGLNYYYFFLFGMCT